MQYQELLTQNILNEDTFIRATFSGRQEGKDLAWTKVVVRPVLIKDKRHLQFSYFDAYKDITKNYEGREAEERLAEVVELPFKNFYVQTVTDDIQVNINKKGKANIGRHKATEVRQIPLAHDREKQRVLSASDNTAFLQAVGIMTKEGKIKADKQDKFVQINEFLKLLEQTGALETFDKGTPIHVVDLGCGNAYLTFALYHYLTYTLGLDVRMTGVDIKADLLQRHADKVANLGWEHLTFTQSRIDEFQPDTPPDIVVALHACDTATDDALANGIRWGSKLIVSAPCCQHHLQAQLCDIPTPSAFRPVWQDGILGERMGDVLTDTFRAQLLRVMGYKTDVVQFVADEHTPRNLMIRAVKSGNAGNAKALQEYLALKSFWGVTPYLEKLLGERFTMLLPEAANVGVG